MKLPDELLASLESGELAAYQVAADWLIAQGDPWGELINAQCQLEGATDPGVFVTFKKRADALLAKHGRAWLGAQVEATWRRGFAEAVRLEDLDALASVLASDVGGLSRDFELVGSPHELLRALEGLRQARPRRLRGLSLRSSGRARSPPSGVSLPFLELERLEVHGLHVEWTFDASTLRRLSVADAPTASLAPWLGSAPHTLERLELLQCEVPHPVLQRLVDGQWALRVLHLEDDLPDDVAAWLADSPALRQLEHLALGGPFTDAGLDAMLKRFARFSRLQSIVLYGGRFGPTIRKWAYKQLPQLTIEPRRPGPEWPGHPRHGARFSA